MPLGKVWGLLVRKTWPTIEQGMISSCPPHCQTCRLMGDSTNRRTMTGGWKHLHGCLQGGKRRDTYPKGHFNILTTPDFHFFIIASNVVEIFFWDGEEATSEGGGPTERNPSMFLMISNKPIWIYIQFSFYICVNVFTYLMGNVSSFLLCFSWSGRLSQPKDKAQSKLPRLWFWPYGDGFVNSKVLRSMVVMSGLTTAV